MVEWCGRFVEIWYPRFCQCSCAEAILFNQCNMQCSFFEEQSEDTFLCHCIPGLNAGDDVSEMAWTCRGAPVNRIVRRLWAGALVGKVQRFAARMLQFAQVTWREDGSWCLPGYKIRNTRMRAVRYITDWHDFEKKWLAMAAKLLKNYRAEKSSQGKIRKDVILY